MKQEEILDWMLEQGIVEDISVAQEFASAITQEQLDSFGAAPVIVVGCMWEGWKLAKNKSVVKILANEIQCVNAIIVKDMNTDGMSLETYGFSIGDTVIVRDYDKTTNSFNASKDGFEWFSFEPEELEFI